MGQFTSYQQVHDLFIEGQELWNKSLIKERYTGSNAWQGRLSEGEFPTGHGTQQRGFRLGAMAAPTNIRWRDIVSDICNNNACSFDPQRIEFAGSDDYTYSLQRTESITDWLCLDGLLFRHTADEEVAHIESQLKRINRNFVEHFDRVRYIHFVDNKWAGWLPPSELEYCQEDCFNQVVNGANEIYPYSWRFEDYDDGQPNETIIRVNCPWTQLYRITPLCLDILRQVEIELNAIDSSYGLYGESEEGGSSEDGMLPSNTTGKMEVIIPDLKSRSLLQREYAFQNRAPGSDPMDKVDPALGIEATVENFMLRMDKDMMRYAPVAPALQPAANSYSADNPLTWAILRMVPRTREVAAKIGKKNVLNRDWLNAPFAITIPFSPAVGKIEKLPDYSGTGTARKGSHAIPEATIQWRSPDWEFNINGSFGFWLMKHNRAFHPRRTELGHAILHRIDHRVRLIDVMTDMPAWRSMPRYEPYCTTATVTETLNVASTRPI
jgi:hypothetical protein